MEISSSQRNYRSHNGKGISSADKFVGGKGSSIPTAGEDKGVYIFYAPVIATPDKEWPTTTVNNAVVLCSRSSRPPSPWYDDSVGFYMLYIENYILHPNSEIVNTLYLNQCFHKYDGIPLLVDQGIKKDFDYIFDRISACEYADECAQPKHLVGVLFQLLLCLLKSKTVQLASGQGNPDKELVNEFLDSVDENFRQKKKVSDYARLFYMSPNYLNLRIKKATGFPASYHIQQRILAEAKRKMIEDKMSLKQIAYSLGYEDIAYFSRFFKKIAGINFTEFRQNLLMRG